MDNDYQGKMKKGIYDFLEEEIMQNHFAELSNELLQSRHIQQTDNRLYTILHNSNHFSNLCKYFETLNKATIKKKEKNREFFYYLDSLEDGRNIINSSFGTPLTDSLVIMGITLLIMFNDLPFDLEKIITREDIIDKLFEGENQDDFQRILFGKVRESVDKHRDWLGLEKKIKRWFREFERIGWLTKIGVENEFCYRINVSIYRLEELYSDEINNLSEFSKRVEAYKLAQKIK
jgi:hypothetical protein